MIRHVELVAFRDDRRNGWIVEAPIRVLCMYGAGGASAGMVLIFN